MQPTWAGPGLFQIIFTLQVIVGDLNLGDFNSGDFDFTLLMFQ